MSTSDLLTIAEAARRSGVPRTTLQSAAEAGKLKTLRIAGYRVVHPQDVEAWLASERKRGRPKTNQGE